MAVSLFTFVDLFDRAVATGAHLLDKGAAHAVEHGGRADDCLDWRLAEDMHPFRFQLMVLVNFSRRWTARAAGLPEPAEAAADLDVAGFKSALADARAYLANLRPEQFLAEMTSP